MTRGKLLDLLTKEAKEYRKNALSSIKRNKHMNDLTQADFLKLKENQQWVQRMVDALLVDFINDVGVGQCCDYGLYTKNLR